MIVDNKDVIREIAAAMLEDMGFETLMASGGAEAVKIYSKQENQDNISLILLDMMMPSRIALWEKGLPALFKSFSCLT